MARKIFISFMVFLPTAVAAAQESSPAVSRSDLLSLVGLLLALCALAVYIHTNRRLRTLEEQAQTTQRERDDLRQQLTADRQKVGLLQDRESVELAGLQNTISDLQARLKQTEDNLTAQRHTAANAVLATSLLPLAEKQYRSKDIKGALETYRRALDFSPSNPALDYRLGYIYTQRGELDTAQKYIDTALELDPGFTPARAAEGYIYRRRAERDPRGKARDNHLFTAESRLLTALYSAPKLLTEDGESWWCILGGMYRDRSLFKKAVDAYRKAAQITPYSSYPQIHLALYQGMDENYEGMQQTFREAERLARQQILANPEDYWFYADLLVARLALGKIQEAEDALNTVLKMLPYDLVYAAPQLLRTLEKLASVMPEGGAHVQDTIQHIREAVGDRQQASAQVSLLNQSFVIPFASSLPALGSHVSIQDDLSEVAKTVDLTEPRPAIVILGGAMDMASQEMQDTRPVIEEGLIPFVQKHNIAVIDGGTDSGVMRLLGEARRKHNATFPLIGVAPVNLVKFQGHDNPDGYDLESGHSHFLLTGEGDWGDETDTMVQFAFTLTGKGQYPGLVLVINGGAIVRQEVYRLTITERLKFPMIVLEGSGRFADTLAQAHQTHQTDDDELREVVTKGDIERVAVKHGPQALIRRLDAILAPKVAAR